LLKAAAGTVDQQRPKVVIHQSPGGGKHGGKCIDETTGGFIFAPGVGFDGVAYEPDEKIDRLLYDWLHRPVHLPRQIEQIPEGDAFLYQLEALANGLDVLGVEERLRLCLHGLEKSLPRHHFEQGGRKL
jgi:hypothetical protein